MHRCALELNALAREVKLKIQAEGAETANLRDLQARYEEILARYENHEDIDFRVAQIKKAPEFYGIRWWHRVLILLETARSYALYVALMGVALVYLIALVC